MKRFLVVLVACARPAPPLAHHVGSTATHADAIACPEAQLRSLAARFPRATLEIEGDARGPDNRGIVFEQCALSETEDACLARARHQIPQGFVELVFDSGDIEHAPAIKLTLEYREVVVLYGYQRRHREATLTFPTMRDRDFDIESILALETELGLHDLGIEGTSARNRAFSRWHVRYTCETYGVPTTSS